MDERFYFNPYMFGGPFSNVPPNMTVPPNLNISNFNENLKDISPKEFYENGYYYYRYLNEMLDYEKKSRELFKENLSNNNNTGNLNK